MTPILTFRLDGVLASWGEVTTGDLRSTLNHPTRSALLGLLGAALGVRRGESERLRALRESLRFAVAVIDQGSAMTDFHTTQRYGAKRGEFISTRKDELMLMGNRGHTNVSKRTYWCDVAYLVSVWQVHASPNPTLEEIAEALREPRFTLCLGRKSCPPSSPLGPHVGEFDGVEEALQSYLATSRALGARWGRRIEPQVSVYFDVADEESAQGVGFLPEIGEQVWRRDLPREGFRAFSARREGRGMVQLEGGGQ